MANTKETMLFLKVFFYLSALNGHSLLLFLTLQNFYFYILVSNLGFMGFLCVCDFICMFFLYFYFGSLFLFVCLFVLPYFCLLVLILYVVIIIIYQYMPVYILMGENEGCGRHG